MKISWEINDWDIQRIKNVVLENDNQFVKKRRERNVDKKGISITRDKSIHAMIMCLLTSQQRSGPDSLVNKFLILNPFPVNEEAIKRIENKEKFIRQVFLKNGLTRMINKNSQNFSNNIEELKKDDWNILEKLEHLNENPSKENERTLADFLKFRMKGFGPKQSRNFLQFLGLTKYEIPLDSRIISWLNKSGFPIKLSSKPLSDIDYYHFIMDGIQVLCEKADIYPCILDAAIFSSFNKAK